MLYTAISLLGSHVIFNTTIVYLFAWMEINESWTQTGHCRQKLSSPTVPIVNQLINAYLIS